VVIDDLRYAVRGLMRAKSLLAVLLVSLALGAGANVAVGRAIYTLLFEAPAGVSDPSTLVSIFTSQSGGGTYGPSSYAEYQSIRANVRALAAVAAIDDRRVDNIGLAAGATTARDAGSRQGRIAAVSGSFFSVLGMRAHAGRLFSDADAADVDRQPRPAVISYSTWQAIGGDATILNRTLVIGGEEFTVAGIAPEGFRGLEAERVTDVWIPLAAPSTPHHRVLSLVARLTPGATVADAARQIGAIAPPPRIMSVTTYTRLAPADREKHLLVAAVVAGTMLLLLLSACVNAANLLLSRAVARRAESAVMLALGASRTRLLRQTLAESVTVAIAATGLGLLLASWMTWALPLLFTAEHAALLDARFAPSLVALALVASAIAGVLIGVAPAMQGESVPAVSALRRDAGAISMSQRGKTWRMSLLSCQIALSIVLLVVASLLRDSLEHALSGDLGFHSRDVAMLTIEGPGSWHTSAEGVAAQEAIARRLRESGRVWAGWASSPPLSAGSRREFFIEDDASGTRESAEFDVNIASQSYFTTMQLAIVEGRLFTPADLASGERVLIVDQRLAAHFFNGQAAGRQLRDANGTLHRIVGVVASGKYRTLQEAPRPTVYVPSAQEYVRRTHLFVYARDHAEQEKLSWIGAVVQAVEPRAAIVRATTLREHLSNALTLDRMLTSLVRLCGLMALVLASIGVYGMVSESVQRRTREIGLRVALGADALRVTRLVFREALVPTAAGLTLGFYALFLINRIARTFVYGVPAPDALTLASASAILIGVIAAAACPPLRRALGVSPSVALRTP
jgi:putative ABC transport system permease protein